MDYIRQLNAFDDWIAANACSTSAQLLWYKLMSVNNSCYWKECFTRTNPSLAGMMNVSENTLKVARVELKEKGLIDFVPGTKRGEPTKYKITILYEQGKVSNISTNNKQVSGLVSNIDTKPDTQITDKIAKTDTQTAYIVNINNKNIDVDKNSCSSSEYRTEIITEYKNATNQAVSEIIETELNILAGQYGVGQVIKAIREASLRNNLAIVYVKGILKNWNKQNGKVNKYERNGKHQQRDFGVRSTGYGSAKVNWEAEVNRGL